MQSKKPLVSVLMPVYNAESFLSASIDSILSQSFKDYEFIILNDGSQDNSRAIIQTYQDPRIQYIHHRKNRGIVATLNDGLKVAKGRYIARMDADDLSLPNRFQRQVDYLEKHSNVGLIASTFFICDENYHIFKTSALPLDDYLIKLSMRFFNPFTHGAVMFRKQLLTAHNLSYSSQHLHYEDFGLWQQLATVTQFKILKKPLFIWMLRKQGVTDQYLSRMTQGVKTTQTHEFFPINKHNILAPKPFYQSTQVTHQEKVYLFDFQSLYQKLLLYASVLAYQQSNFGLAVEFMIRSVAMNPFTYVQKLITMLIPFVFKPKHHQTLKELLGK